MAGQPSMPQPGPAPVTYQPYGVPLPAPMPAFNPGAAKQPGSTSTKIWGVLLLIFGAMSLLQLVSAAVMMFGGFNGGAAFSPGLSPAAKAELDRMTQELISSSLSRPTYWLHMVGELAVVALSWLAGLFLLIKPRPKGAKLAVARAALVLLLLPVYGYEQTVATEAAMDSQQAIMRAQFAEAEAKRGKGRKGPSAEQMMETMNPIMKGVTYGSMVVVVIIVLVINGLMAFQMSRPAVRAYLEGAAADKSVIPGYDPSMGLVGGMPLAAPGVAPMPPAGAPPPGGTPPA